MHGRMPDRLIGMRTVRRAWSTWNGKRPLRSALFKAALCGGKLQVIIRNCVIYLRFPATSVSVNYRKFRMVNLGPRRAL